MAESKYESQMKNLRKNYVRFPLDLKPDILDAFKTACKENKKFIARYIANAGNQQDTEQ